MAPEGVFERRNGWRRPPRCTGSFCFFSDSRVPPEAWPECPAPARYLWQIYGLRKILVAQISTFEHALPLATRPKPLVSVRLALSVDIGKGYPQRREAE